MDNQETKDKNSILNRRDWMKLMTAGPVAAMAPALAGLPSATPEKRASRAYEPKFFSPHQYRTLGVLSDLIIPADERSGSAREAHVPEFIDGLLDATGGRWPSVIIGRAGWADIGTAVLGGLTWLDLESNRLYAHNFIDCAAGEQKQLLNRIAYPKNAVPEDINAAAAFNHIRDLVVGGFFSSEEGVKDLPYLGNKVVAEWEGCPQADLEQLGVSYNVPWRHWNELKMKE